MENAPDIILFWAFGIVIFILAIALLIAAVVMIKKGRRQSDKRIQTFGKLCLTMSIICSVPIILTAGYILYIYIT